MTTPQQVIDAYLAECRRVNGDEYADTVRLVYKKDGSGSGRRGGTTDATA